MKIDRISMGCLQGRSLSMDELECHRILFCHKYFKDLSFCQNSKALKTGLLGITSYSRQDPEMGWRSFFAVQQQKCFIKFWSINKTEVQKIDVEVKVEVSSWLWLD